MISVANNFRIKGMAAFSFLIGLLNNSENANDSRNIWIGPFLNY